MHPLSRPFAAALALSAVTAATAAAQSYVVVVNDAVPATSLAATELEKVFERTATRWPNGVLAEPVDEADGSALRERFSQDVFHKSTTQMKAYWQTQIFSGRTVPPLELQTEQAVLAFVQTHAGAIAYVASATPLPEGVRRLRVDR